MTNPAPGWYDDGSGEQRWWDGYAWTTHVSRTEDTTTGFGVDVTFTPHDIPMYFWAYTDPADSTRGWVRVYHGIGGAPAWDATDRFADADFDEYTGPAVNVLVHTSRPEQLAVLHPELREIIEDLRAQILASAGIDG